MQIKSVINLTLALSTIAFTAATIFFIKAQMEYFFLFPILAIISFALLAGLNLSKQSIRLQSAEFEREKHEIKNLPLGKRMTMFGIVSGCMILTAITSLVAGATLESPITDQFTIAFFVPWLICRIAYNLFASPMKYLVVVGIYISWCATILMIFEQFNIAKNAEPVTMVVNVFCFYLMFELSRSLTRKVTGFKPLIE